MTIFFNSIVMLRFPDTKVAREKFIVQKTIKIWDVDKTVISKLIETKFISKYLIG